MVSASSNGLICFTNCLLAQEDGSLVEKDLWVDETQGLILDAQVRHFILSRFYWVLKLFFLGLNRKHFTSVNKGLIELLIWKATSLGKSYPSRWPFLLVALFALFVGITLHIFFFFSPGFLDIQLNGAYNFDFSVYEGDEEVYRQGLKMVAERIVETGITS